VRGRKEGPLKGESEDCTGDGSLQTQFGVNLQPKGAKNRIDEVKLTGLL
jgi:hypothetical protein